MVKKKKILEKVLTGSKNIPFNDFIQLVEGFGFYLSRVSGSHHIFTHSTVKELVKLQNVITERQRSGKTISNQTVHGIG